LGNGYVGKHLYETLSKHYNVSIHSKINLNYHDKNNPMINALSELEALQNCLKSN